MHLYLGGHLNYFDSLQRVDLELELHAAQPLKEILLSLKIPLAEVYLVTVNGEVVQLDEACIQPDDHVRVYPPVGGG